MPNNEENSISPEKILSKNHINSILYSDPFLKAGFISRLVKDTTIDILYLDLDLLYSGYVVSGQIQSQKNLTLLQPTSDTIGEILTELLSKASNTHSLIVVDSLNGLFNLLNQRKDVGKTVTSLVMLIASIARITNSYLVLASMARFKKEEGWLLSPTGKRLIETKNSKRILLEYANDGIELTSLEDSSKQHIPADKIPI